MAERTSVVAHAETANGDIQGARGVIISRKKLCICELGDYTERMKKDFSKVGGCDEDPMATS